MLQLYGDQNYKSGRGKILIILDK